MMRVAYLYIYMFLFVSYMCSYFSGIKPTDCLRYHAHTRIKIKKILKIFAMYNVRYVYNSFFLTNIYIVSIFSNLLIRFPIHFHLAYGCAMCYEERSFVFDTYVNFDDSMRIKSKNQK